MHVLTFIFETHLKKGGILLRRDKMSFYNYMFKSLLKGKQIYLVYLSF